MRPRLSKPSPHPGLITQSKSTPTSRALSIALRYSLLTLIAFWILSVRTSSADTLKELLKSRQLEQGKHSRNVSSKDEVITDGDPTSNFSSIWRNRASPQILITWLDVSASGYKPSDPIASIAEDHASAQVSLRDSHGKKTHLTVQIPKPVFSTMAEFNQLGSFRRFRPPQLQIKSSDSIEVGGARADIYQSTRNECSLVIRLERFGILNISRKDCQDPTPLVKLARALNIKRLNEKLTS